MCVCVCVCMHWGEPYQFIPSIQNHKLVQRLDAGLQGLHEQLALVKETAEALEGQCCLTLHSTVIPSDRLSYKLVIWCLQQTGWGLYSS